MPKDPSPAESGPPGENPDSKTATADSSSYYEKPVWKRFYAFVLGPVLVAAVMLALFTFFTTATRENTPPEELVRQMRTGGQHGRWQAAFALTKYLQPSIQSQNAQLLRESDASYRQKVDSVRALLPELLDIYRDPKLGEPELRRFLALAFGYLGDPRVIPVLAQSAQDPDVELAHYALAGIVSGVDPRNAAQQDQGVDESVIQAVIQASRRSEADIRATATYVLGVLGSGPALERLREALEGVAPAVRWNAAFGLARHGDGAGERIIAEILDRGPLYYEAGRDQAKQDDLFLNAVQSAGMVRSPMLEERLVRIAKSDKNLRARDSAIKILEKFAIGTKD